MDTLKKACETQLKKRGIDVGCFVIQGGRAHFKQCTREEALAAKKTKKGSTMYVLQDPNAAGAQRLMKAVEGEGMPTFKNPFIHGNLFLIFTIEFPQHLEHSAQVAIRKLLPPPLHVPSIKEDQDGVEVHLLTDIDPVASYKSNVVNMKAGGEAYDDDDDDSRSGGGFGGAQQMQCQQQ